MKIRLSINYGVDDKFKIVMDTIQVCHNYFDEVQILTSAPKILSEKWNNVILPSNCYVEDMGGYIGYYETGRRLSVHGLNTGDWIMWLDSDERPSFGMLENLKSFLETCEKNGTNSVCFPLYYHYYSEYDGVWMHDKSHWSDKVSDYKTFIPKSFEEHSKRPHDCFAPIRLTRIDPTIYMLSNFGGHTIPMHTPMVMGFFPHHVAHIKTKVSFNLSVVLSTYGNMFIDCGNVPELDYIINSEEHMLIDEIKKETGVLCGNDIVMKLRFEKDEKLKMMFYNAFSKDCFKNSKFHSYRYYYSWAIDDSLMIEYPEEVFHIKCGYECCLYNNVQL